MAVLLPGDVKNKRNLVIAGLEWFTATLFIFAFEEIGRDRFLELAVPCCFIHFNFVEKRRRAV